MGTGDNINFWLDSWCGPLALQLNIPSQLHHNLTAKVNDFIVNFQWIFPPSVLIPFPVDKHLAEHVTIPVEDFEDKLVWRKSNTGEISFKEAFLFKYGVGQNVKWAKSLWCPDIPPSESLLVWKIMHNKVPTVEMLQSRGISIPSMCSSCNIHGKSTFHLFFECFFAIKLWNWLFSIINTSIQFNSVEDFWLLLDRNWSQQCKLVIKACIMNILNVIWFSRNQIRFQNKLLHWKSAINIIVAKTSIAGNNTKQTARGGMLEFTILKACKVNIKPPRAPIIKEVIWSPHLASWFKVNTDGASTKNPVKASTGGIFRNSEGECIGCFSQFLGNKDALHAELVAAMIAIEISYHKGFHNIWLESDSQLVNLAFNSNSVVPWCNNPIFRYLVFN